MEMTLIGPPSFSRKNAAQNLGKQSSSTASYLQLEMIMVSLSEGKT